MAGKQKKRRWPDEEKRSICFQTTTPGVSVAQVARRYAMNANMVFKWLRDPRFAPKAAQVVVAPETDVPCFLPVEIVGRTESSGADFHSDPVPPAGMIEIDIAGGHRLRISGAYDPEALSRLIRGLSG